MVASGMRIEFSPISIVRETLSSRSAFTLIWTRAVSALLLNSLRGMHLSGLSIRQAFDDICMSPHRAPWRAVIGIAPKTL